MWHKREDGHVTEIKGGRIREKKSYNVGCEDGRRGHEPRKAKNALKDIGKDKKKDSTL